MADEEWVDIGAAARFAARPVAQIALSRACLATSHRDGRFGAISGVRACLVVLLLLLVTQIASAGAAESAPPGTSIPAIASIAKIKIGYSTQQEIDAQWGEGKTIIGGHPNSGRLWRVNGTSWVIHTELRKGERYFRIDGVPAFVLGRNPVGVNPAAFAEHFQNAAAAGERFMRIHLEMFRIAQTGQSRYPEAVMHRMEHAGGEPVTAREEGTPDFLGHEVAVE